MDILKNHLFINEKTIKLIKGNGYGFYAIVLLAMISYLVLGAIPIVPLENDGMRMTLGIQGYMLYGDYTYSYNYVSQSGIYKIIGVTSELSGWEPFYVFSIITFVSSLFFIVFTTCFLSRLLNAKFMVCLISVVAFQEVYVSGYYPNSSMLAAVFLSVALLLLTWKERNEMIVLSAIFFSLAVWCRIDAILIGFAFVLLLFVPKRRYFLSIFLFGLVFIGTILMLYKLSNINLQSFLEQFSGSVGSSPDIKRAVRIYSTVFTFAAIYFIVLGVFQLYKLKKWRLIGITLLSPLPLIIAYGLDFDSPKKILYGIIFFAIPIVYGINFAFETYRKKKNVFILIGFLLVIVQYIFTPAYELIFNRSISCDTSDEPRLRGAIAYTPIFWAKHRRLMLVANQIYEEKFSEYLQQNNPAYIISHDWMANQWLLYFLQSNGYRITESENYANFLEDGQRLILMKNSDIVYLVRWRPETILSLPNPLLMEIQKMTSVLYVGPDYTTTNYAQESCLAEEFEGSRLSDWGRFETILYQR